MSGKRFLLDTNVIIDFLQGRDDLKDKFLSSGYIAIPHIVTGELYYGAELSNNSIKNLKNIKSFLKSFDILSSDVVRQHFMLR